MTDEQLFHVAVGVDGDERSNYLDDACLDAEQRERVESLLLAHAAKDSLLDTESASGSLAETRAQSNLPKSIGDFEIFGELGRGGMGVVYEARQKSLKRRVALKVLSCGLGLSSKAILRFRREAEAAGKLHHTNIVPIYTTGEDKGIHYYAMELVDGPSLDRVIRERKRCDAETESLADTAASCKSHGTAEEFTNPSAARSGGGGASGEGAVTSSISTTSGTTYFDEVATMIAEVADALDHAHELGVIHRDVKPSNLLLGPDGRLSINDFGLARMLEQPGMTVSGEFVGSPLYMSPEQITAGRVALDHRTDIYSLGATLYELLTLQPPFPGQSRDQVLSQILHKEASSTRKFNRKIPVDLDTICMKAIDKDPDRRYQTAGKLAEDLRKFVNRHAVSARRIGLVGKSIKLVRRNPLGTTFVLFAFAVASVGFGNWYSYRKQERERLVTEVVDLARRGQFEVARSRLMESGDILSPGWRSLLEGEILLNEGESEVDATEVLEQAALSLPNDTMAQSMLAVSYFLSGQEDDYIKMLKRVYASPAPTFNEKLFKGYALHWFATEDGVSLLDSAIEENSSYPIAHRFRGESLTIHGLNIRDRREAIIHVDQSIRDLQAASTMVGENPGINQSLVYAFLARGIIYRDLFQAEKSELAFQEARRLAYDNCDIWFNSEDTLYSPLAFHFVTNSDLAFAKLMIENSEQLLDQDRPRQGYIEVKIPSFLFGQMELPIAKRSELALAVHDMAPQGLRALTQYVPAFIATDSANADREIILQRLEKDLPTRMQQRSGIYLLLDWVALRLLKSERSTLDKVAARIKKGYANYFVSEHREWGIALADYMLGDIDEAELKAKLLDSRSVSTYAYLTIAANRIAEGNRTGAREALVRSVDEGFYMYYAPKWSKAFLRRVGDPNWLPWFPPHRTDEPKAVE